MGWDFNPAFMPYNKRTKKHRAMLHHIFGPAAVDKQYHVQTREARQLIGLLLKDPQNFRSHLSRYSFSPSLSNLPNSLNYIQMGR